MMGFGRMPGLFAVLPDDLKLGSTGPATGITSEYIGGYH
jgi:hypothetical protein